MNNHPLRKNVLPHFYLDTLVEESHFTYNTLRTFTIPYLARLTIKRSTDSEIYPWQVASMESVKRGREKLPSENPSPMKKAREIIVVDSTSEDVELDNSENDVDNANFNSFRSNTTVLFFKHYLVLDLSEDEAQEVFLRLMLHLMILKPNFQSSYFNKVTNQINIAFPDVEALEACNHRMTSFAEKNFLEEDTKDLAVNIEGDILEAIMKDPEEEKSRSLYFSPLKSSPPRNR